jgi:hypothetical protein
VSEHEDVARRLREQGPASAPPRLLDSVMAQVRAEVRAEPRGRREWPRRSPRWRPVLGWATAAAALVAIGFGVAHLPTGGSSSSSSSSAESTRGPLGAAPSGSSAANAKVATSRAFTVSRRALALALPRYAGQVKRQDAVVQLDVSASAYRSIAGRLARLERSYAASPRGHRLVVRLVRAGTR